MNGVLKLKISLINGKTAAEQVFFTPPFKLYSPFYSGGTAHFVSMCAAAGVLKGDSNSISVEVGKGCKAALTDQGYQKLFNTDGGSSRQRLEIKVGENASFKYVPHPIMTFGGCNHKAENFCGASESSELIFSEIYCCGRTAMGEEFALERFRSRTEIKIGSKACFIDNTLIEPKAFSVRGTGFFEGFTHTGIFFAYSPDGELEQRIAGLVENAPENVEAACTACTKGLAVRAVGRSGDDIFSFFKLLAA